jgi:hypothetical protein
VSISLLLLPSTVEICLQTIAYYTSLTPVWVPPLPTPLPAGAGAVPPGTARPRFRLPILCTRLLPTASTAPRGANRLGVWLSPCCTLNRRMLVLFHTPAVPLATTISLANTKPQSKDSYQPRDRVDHSKRCTRIGEGSIPGTVVDLMVFRAFVVSVLESSSGLRVRMSIRVVCRGSSLSHDSSCDMLAFSTSDAMEDQFTHVTDGVKNSFAPRLGVALKLARLVVLFWRENVGCPTGILPRAFSDMPRSCRGTDSSIEEAIDALRDAPREPPDGGGCTGILGCCGGLASSASESSSSSLPIAKALFSSGTLPNDGVRAAVGLLRLSMDVCLDSSAPSPSLRSWFWRSISSCPLSSVKSRNAWNFFFDLVIAYTKLGLSVNGQFPCMISFPWYSRLY